MFRVSRYIRGPSRLCVRYRHVGRYVVIRVQLASTRTLSNNAPSLPSFSAFVVLVALVDGIPLCEEALLPLPFIHIGQSSLHRQTCYFLDSHIIIFILSTTKDDI
jgi:hypothetical protein